VVAALLLARGRLTVRDATNLQPDARKPLAELARKYHVQKVAIVFDLPEELCHRHNEARPGRSVAPGVVTAHRELLEKARRALDTERFRAVYVLATPEDVAAATVERYALPVNRRHDRGPFDIVGDVHGCLDELLALLRALGYEVGDAGVRPPEGRKLVFVGDLVDRGPKVSGVLKLALSLAEAGALLCVRGNHDDKLQRKLEGHDVRVTHGLDASLSQLDAEPEEFRAKVLRFLSRLPTHLVLDGGRLVVAHAGLKAEMHGRVSGPIRSFALYGDTTGEKDEFGLPVRRDWAADYRGKAHVVYGHTPVAEAAWVNRTLNLDTGCVFGGKLTALRYPEMEIVSVPAAAAYAPSARPFPPPALTPAGPQPPGDR
jgi:protein phosphatase